MTIENYFERRIRPISEDIKSPTNNSSSNNLIDEDQLARTFQEIVNCINLDDDDIQLSDVRALNNFHSHHSLLPEYESIFGGTKGSFNATVGSKSSTTVNSVVGKSFLDDDWFPNTQVQSNTSNISNASISNSSNVNTNSTSVVRPPGYPMINRPITPSSTASSSSNSVAFNRAFNNHPPSDYVCKLCNCDGHWMKDCKLYEPRSPTSSISSGSSSSFKNGNGQHHQGYNNNNSPNSNNRTFLPPGNYVCRLCNVSGHWIDQCSKFQPKHLELGNGNTENGSGSFSNSAPVLPPMLGPGPTPNYRPPAYLSKPVPSNYICNLCNRSGHWIQQCTEFTPIINHKRQ